MSHGLRRLPAQRTHEFDTNRILDANPFAMAHRAGFMQPEFRALQQNSRSNLDMLRELDADSMA